MIQPLLFIPNFEFMESINPSIRSDWWLYYVLISLAVILVVIRTQKAVEYVKKASDQ